MKENGTEQEEAAMAFRYDDADILEELVEEAPKFCLAAELKEQILSRKRNRRLKNVSIKLDPAQLIALRKIAVTKSIPYQTLIRQMLAEGIRRELGL